MQRPILWIHGEALGPANPALLAYPGRPAVFVFDSALGAINVDTIDGFDGFDGAGSVSLDQIQLASSVFSGLTSGVLASSAFESGSDDLAGGAAVRILYNTTTGALLYDADGSGAGAAIQFAVLTNKPAGLAASDFVVV